MGILDTFRVNKAEKKKAGITPPPQGHALVEILKDRNKSDLFGKLLERDGYKDLAEKLAAKALGQDVDFDESEIHILEENRQILSEKIITSEKVEKFLTKENIIDFAKNHPDFEKLVNLASPEKTLRAIQNRLKEIAVTDEGTFDIIVGAIDTRESYTNGEYKKRNDEIEKLLEEKSVTSEEYLAAIAIEDPKKKKEALEELAARTNTPFKRILNLLSRGKYGKDNTLQELTKAEGSLEAADKKLDAYQSEIANVLFASVSGNDSMRKAFFGELVNEREPREHKGSLTEMKTKAFDEKKAGAAWEVRKKKEKYSTKGTAEQAAIKQAFIDEQKEEHRKNSGESFWDLISNTFFDQKADDFKNKLT